MSRKYKISDHSECFPEEILLKYINDELSIEESNTIEKHLSDCEICSDFIDGVLMLESTESFLTSKEGLNKAITLTINQTQKKRKLNPYLFRAIAAVALILVICGTYLIIDVILNDKNTIQIQKENEIAQTIKGEKKIENDANSEIAQTITDSKVTEKDEIVKLPDSGIIYITEETNTRGQESQNGEKVLNEITKITDADSESTNSTVDITTISSLNKKSEGTITDYIGGINDATPEEDEADDTKNISVNRTEQIPGTVVDLAVISAENKDISIFDRNYKSDKSPSERKSKVETQKEVSGQGQGTEMSGSRDIKTGDYNDADFNSIAPASGISGEVILASDFETFSYTTIEDKPSFPGGFEALIKFVNENISYPNIEGIEYNPGKVMVSFIIDTAGNVTNVSIFKGINPVLDAEAIRVIKMLPSWTPGKLNGQPVNVSFIYPFDFDIK